MTLFSLPFISEENSGFADKRAVKNNRHSLHDILSKTMSHVQFGDSLCVKGTGI